MSSLQEEIEQHLAEGEATPDWDVRKLEAQIIFLSRTEIQIDMNDHQGERLADLVKRRREKMGLPPASKEIKF